MRALGQVSRLLSSLAITVVFGCMLTAALVRLSPGFGVDERQLDPTRDVAALRAQQAARPEQGNFLRYSLDHTAAILRGDLGVSRNWNRPVSDLLRERWTVTARLMITGVAGGWGLALALSLPGALPHKFWWSLPAASLSGVLLCVPSAALALMVFVYGLPVQTVMPLVIFPRVYQYLYNLMAHAAAQPHVLAARARGISPMRILFRHVLSYAAPQAWALVGVSVSMAFGAAVVVEVICDLPGIGQLAWKAALARDLPLLVTLTMLVTLVVQVSNAAADLTGFQRHEAAV